MEGCPRRSAAVSLLQDMLGMVHSANSDALDTPFPPFMPNRDSLVRRLLGVLLVLLSHLPASSPKQRPRECNSRPSRRCGLRRGDLHGDCRRHERRHLRGRGARELDRRRRDSRPLPETRTVSRHRPRARVRAQDASDRRAHGCASRRRRWHDRSHAKPSAARVAGGHGDAAGKSGSGITAAYENPVAVIHHFTMSTP